MTKFQIKPSQPQPLHNEKEETESKNPYGELSVIELESIVGGWGGWPWPLEEERRGVAARAPAARAVASARAIEGKNI